MLRSMLNSFNDAIVIEGTEFVRIWPDENHSPVLRAYVNESATIFVTADRDLVAQGYDAVWHYALDLYDWGDEEYSHTVSGDEFRSPQEAYEAAVTVQQLYDEIGRRISVLMDSGLVSDVQ